MGNNREIAMNMFRSIDTGADPESLKDGSNDNASETLLVESLNQKNPTHKNKGQLSLRTNIEYTPQKIEDEIRKMDLIGEGLIVFDYLECMGSDLKDPICREQELRKNLEGLAGFSQRCSVTVLLISQLSSIADKYEDILKVDSRSIAGCRFTKKTLRNQVDEFLVMRETGRKDGKKEIREIARADDHLDKFELTYDVALDPETHRIRCFCQD